MSLADFDPGRFRRNQGAGNAELLVAAEQAIGIENLEGKAQNGCHGPKRYVTLLPVEAQTQHPLALVYTHADHAGIRDRTRVGSGKRTGQRKTGDLLATGQPRQVMVFLFLGAIMQQ